MCTALSNALGRYRQLSSNAVEESYFFMEIIPDTNKYTLPKDILEVHKVFRTGVGQTSGSTGATLEPFQLAQTNTYLLSSTNNLGGLATFDFYAQYKELAGRMFGSFIEFVWSRSKHEITILQRPRNQEQLMLKCCVFLHKTIPLIGIFCKSSLKVSSKDMGLSVACDGVCLTLISFKSKIMEFSY